MGKGNLSEVEKDKEEKMEINQDEEYYNTNHS